MKHDDMLAVALAEARQGLLEGNPPVGAVIASGGQILGQGRNQMVSEKNPMRHAEMAAILDAQGNGHGAKLHGATLYSTLASCPMCCWAAMILGIKTIVLGCDHDGRNDRMHFGSYSMGKLADMMGKDIDVVVGARTQECEDLWNDWVSQNKSPGILPGPDESPV